MTPKQTRDALVRVTKFVDEYQKMRGLHPDNIHSLHFGMERGATLTVSDLRTLLAALPVGDAEPVARWRVSANWNTWVEWFGEAPEDKTLLYTAPPPTAVPAGFAIEKWLEREAWSFLRNVLTQGQAIEMDYRNNKYESYEHLSARLDEAARERRDQLEAAIAARPDAPAGEKA